MFASFVRGAITASVVVMTFASSVSQANEAPRVVASLKPVHSLVAGVMGDVGEPDLIVDGQASPHGFALKPSDVAALNDADAVFWVGPALETFLTRPVESLPDTVRRIRFMDVEGMQLLRFREDAAFESHDHDHAHDHEAHADDGHGHDEHGHDEHAHDEHEGNHERHAGSQYDPHIWLDPRNAVVMVREVASVLSEIDPAHADVYRANAAVMTEKLNALTEDVHARLADTRDVPFAVFHDAYQYFEHRFELNAVGSVSLNPEAPPSAERVREIQGKLKRLNVACIFSEPQFPEKLVKVAAEGSAARFGQLDPLGVAKAAGPDQYFATIRSLADSLAGCLAADS